MQINLSGHPVDISRSLRGYVNANFTKIARHFDPIDQVQVILAVEKLTQSGDATYTSKPVKYLPLRTTRLFIPR